MPYIECELRGPGIHPSEVSLAVKDINGTTSYVRVQKDLPSYIGEVPYIQVGLIQENRKENRWLIELPAETDAGFCRMWMDDSKLLRKLPESASST